MPEPGSGRAPRTRAAQLREGGGDLLGLAGFLRSHHAYERGFDAGFVRGREAPAT
ncbi:hypothetical protein ACFC3F_04095 [Microbacterium sp. NPDC055910]|uniref:hypothetical protein n=1 Tax=Microbacterium sp. NPDC055910 TaxID=3345659 RepID=UPI0035D65683